LKKKNFRTPLIYLVLLIVVVLMATQFDMAGSQSVEIDSSQFLEAVREGTVQHIVISDYYNVYGIYKDSQYTVDQMPKRYDFSFQISSEAVLLQEVAQTIARRDGIPLENVSPEDYGFTKTVSMSSGVSVWDFIPYLILIGAMGFLAFFMMRQQGGGNGINSFGKSKARMVTGESNKVTFADVAGAEEEKEELAEIVDFLKNPARFTKIGARIPKGVLLFGPPGTGKTLFAKAVAGEAGVPFYSISGSDFVEMFVGVGASRVRDLFNTAKKTAPAIIFIDEIDAVGRHRGAGVGGGHDEREQTLNQLLVEMDGFDPHAGIIVVAATNRPDILDPALLRPGRFDRQITVNTPDVKGREAILQVHSRKKPLGPDVNLHVIAQRTPGFTGADLENVLNEAAILAARRKKEIIEMAEVEEAINRVLAGPEKKSRIITKEDQRITAYHEAGHAIVAQALSNCDDVHEISIIQRGQAAGYTLTLPEKEKQHMTRSQLEDSIVMLLGGRVAEAIHIGDISTGASNDIQRATEIARRMIVEFGMSEKIGPLFLGGGNQEVFLGRDFGTTRNYSEEVASVIDDEIHTLIETAYKRAEKILKDNKAAMELVTAKLLEEERLDGPSFRALCRQAGMDAPEPVREEEKKAGEAQPQSAQQPAEQSAEPTAEQEEQPQAEQATEPKTE
jgi:cell division protease FtsH